MEEEKNICDSCTFVGELIRIDSKDFKPLKSDKFSSWKFKRAIEEGITKFCRRCYLEYCCLK